MKNGYTPISAIKKVASEKGSHWFSPGAMSFFNSRVSKHAIVNYGYAYFVSSEQFVPSSGVPFPRMYTARVMDLNDATVNDLLGTKFQQFSSGEDAWDAIKEYLGIEE